MFRGLLLAGLLCAAAVPALADSYKDAGGTAVAPVVIIDPTVSGALGTVANPLHTTGGGGGGSVTQGTSPWVDNITQWASGVLGAMANYGTSPGAVLVPGVNAFVTNTVAVTQSTSPWISGITQWASGTLGAMANYGTSPGAVLVPGVNAAVTSSALPAGAATAANQVLDPCSGVKSTTTFAITSGTQTSLVAAVSAKKVYICSIVAITAIADNANFYDVGAAGACSGAATEAVIGASSNAATNGLNLAANGGLTLGNGLGTVAFTQTANATLCVVTSSAGPFSGALTYVQQ